MKRYDHIYYQRPYNPTTDQAENADHQAAIDAAIAQGKQIDVDGSHKVYANGLWIARTK